MAKELSKVGIITGNDIKAPHVTQSVDAFTGLDAYDVTLSGSLEVTGSTNIKGDTKVKGDVEVTDGSIVAINGNIISSAGNIVATAGKVIATSITSSGGILGVTISASADLYVEDDLTVGNNLEVRSNVTASNNISASGDIYGTNFIASSNVTASNNISASGDIYGTDYIGSSNVTAGSSMYISTNNSTFNRGLYLSGDTAFIERTNSNLTQVSLNKTNNYTNQTTIFAGSGSSGFNFRTPRTGTNGYGNLQDSANMQSQTLLSNNDTQTKLSFEARETSNPNIFKILSTQDIQAASGRGAEIWFGSTNSEGFIKMYMFNRPFPPLTGNNNGLLLSGAAALELQSDNAYKTTAGSWIQASDSRLKEDIVTASIDTCYNRVKNLPLKYYRWKDEIQEYPVNDEHMLGWIAQDVEAILPNAVEKSPFKTWSTYTGSLAITGSDNETILEPGERYQDTLAGSEIIEDRHTLQSDQIIKMMYGAIQKLQEKVEALETQISGSNS